MKRTPESREIPMVLSQGENLFFDNFSKSPQKRNPKMQRSLEGLWRFRNLHPSQQLLSLNLAQVTAFSARNMTCLNFLRILGSNSMNLPSCYATQDKSFYQTVCLTKTVRKLRFSRSRFLKIERTLRIEPKVMGNI